jgi:RNA polymerase sigma factor (sigma-70 family)
VKVAARTGYQIAVDDLHQEGCVAALEASSSWDSSRGASPKTWALYKAEKRMLDYLRENDHLSRAHRIALKKAGTAPEDQPKQPYSLEATEAHRWLEAEADDYDGVLDRLVVAEFEMWARTQHWWRGHMPTIYQMWMEGFSQVAISKVIGVTESRITQILRVLRNKAEEWGRDDETDSRTGEDAQPGWIV